MDAGPGSGACFFLQLFIFFSVIPSYETALRAIRRNNINEAQLFSTFCVFYGDKDKNRSNPDRLTVPDLHMLFA